MNTIGQALGQIEFFKQCKEVVKSLGVVFGDIGTSPIYTLPVIFLFLTPTPANILGVLSLIIWTLFILVTVEYAWLAMSLGKKGEGGTIVLKELLVPLLSSPKWARFFTILSFVGMSLFFGDGVITPAVSILSAVEGILLIPGLGHIAHSAESPQALLIVLACLIAILLFVFQRRGTERVSIAFGPIMLVWFTVLGLSGFNAILKAPMVLYALNPWHAIWFLLSNGFVGFFTLTGVILCATGGEALYADMGHLGRKPIQRAWYFVLIALALNYLGQGAFLLHNAQAHRAVFYNLVVSQVSPAWYVLFLILTIFAAIIASQAMISGVFSIVYQGITTSIIPMFKIDYTSNRLRSQVYIASVNWILMTAVLFMILQFGHSHNLAAAYGFAVTGTMTITAIMMTMIFWHRRAQFKTMAAAVVTAVAFLFLLFNLCKIPQGAFWSLFIALFPFSLILVYTAGQRRLYKALSPMPLADFLPDYEEHYRVINKIKGTALFFVRDIKHIEPYVVQTMFTNNIMYDDNIIVSVVTRDDPFGVIGFFKGSLAPGFRIFEIHMGYMEMLDIEKIMTNAGIHPKVIFYGLEEIVTKNVAWKIYSFIKHVLPSFVQFYKLPPAKLHGVVSSVEM